MDSRPQSLFRKLAGILGKERETVVADNFGLSAEDIDLLTEFSHDARSWELYLRLLDNAAILYGEALLSARDDVSLHEIRGTILGLRKAARIVDETLARAKQLKDANERERGNADAERLAKSATHYGTPGWGRNHG